VDVEFITLTKNSRGTVPPDWIENPRPLSVLDVAVPVPVAVSPLAVSENTPALKMKPPDEATKKPFAPSTLAKAGGAVPEAGCTGSRSKEQFTGQLRVVPSTSSLAAKSADELLTDATPALAGDPEAKPADVAKAHTMLRLFRFMFMRPFSSGAINCMFSK
jgi:hypothetical protein